ncbi:hypothetical protein AVEN_127958-1 [Araneus ventricosus]|uniref:Uncharacterized protein n=1 Tax=Araneus ventricosus TaxID=182803 RepID=A0A4Y2A105_ARAVE|nr:hypothetical protein AVEN_127958-1 [Araneus ventricosus]
MMHTKENFLIHGCILHQGFPQIPRIAVTAYSFRRKAQQLHQSMSDSHLFSLPTSSSSLKIILECPPIFLPSVTSTISKSLIFLKTKQHLDARFSHVQAVKQTAHSNQNFLALPHLLPPRFRMCSVNL